MHLNIERIWKIIYKDCYRLLFQSNDISWKWMSWNVIPLHKIHNRTEGRPFMKTRKKWLRKTTAICTADFGELLQFHLQHLQQTVTLPLKRCMGKKVTEMASSYATSIEESQSLMSGMQEWHDSWNLKIPDAHYWGLSHHLMSPWLDNVITLSNDISFTEGKEGILMKVPS